MSPGWVAPHSLCHSLSAVHLPNRPICLGVSEAVSFLGPFPTLSWAKGTRIRPTHLLRFPSKGVWTQFSLKGLNVLLLQPDLCFRKNSTNGVEMR